MPTDPDSGHPAVAAELAQLRREVAELRRDVATIGPTLAAELGRILREPLPDERR